ncbi:MFS transporter [Streptomyces atriruber]|uniref:MFS transporter n=1 Tax=Streptomyces atriruber TaxID=545121 RepID=A0ABV3BWL0_9ACTN
MADGYTVAPAALVLPLGAIGDRIGRRNVLIADTIVFDAASLAASFADSTTALIAWRAVMGLGAAMIMPGTLSTITAVSLPSGGPRAWPPGLDSPPGPSTSTPRPPSTFWTPRAHSHRRVTPTTAAVRPLTAATGLSPRTASCRGCATYLERGYAAGYPLAKRTFGWQAFSHECPAQ